MQAKRVLKIAGILLVACIVLCGAAVAGIYWDIHRSVQHYCAVAQQAHPCPGDDVEALIAYMNSPEHSLRERNLAVWTLGRLQDPRALPALGAVYTGEPCDHDRCLCQYELKKAIKLCGGTP